MRLRTLQFKWEPVVGRMLGLDLLTVSHRYAHPVSGPRKVVTVDHKSLSWYNSLHWYSWFEAT